MEFENWITQLSENLPNFTVRLYLLAFFFLWIILSTLLLVVNKKRKKKKKKSLKIRYLITGVFLLLLATISYFFYNQYLINIFGNNILYITIPIAASSLIFLIKHFLRIFNIRKVFKIFYISEICTLLLLIISILIISLFTVPHVSLSNNSKILETAGEITLNFSSPLRKSHLRITITPESNVHFEYTYFFGLVESVKITPMESFLPDQKVVIYTTGIQRIFPGGIRHENSQEFFTPRAPEVEEVVLGADIQNVSIEQTIKLDLDINDQHSIEWSAIFIPHTEYEIIRNLDDSVIIKPEKLKQGTSYQLEIIKSIIKYNPKTFEKISIVSEEVVSNITFKTAPAPGITSFNRESGIISNSQPLKIDFEVGLKEESLKDRTNISPYIDGTISLSSDKKQLIFTPKGSFAKNTEYKFTIKSGVENILGGYTEEDLTITFKTPGYVTLLYASPRNGSTNILITTSTISLTFNQPIDHSSVEERFSITPNLSGTFSWSGNTLSYKLANNLAYGTRYTISIANGIKATYGIDSTSTITTSFTTKSQTFLLNVPLYFQTESFTCNLAATRMVLGYKGLSSSESAIRNWIGIGQNPNADWVDHYGVHWGPISSYITSRGVSNTIKSGWNLTSALEEVKKGHPILVYIYNGSSVPIGPFTLDGGYTGYKGMHSAVIVGYIGTPQSPSTVIVYDPWRGKRYLAPNTFLYLWSYLGYTGIVIY